MNSQSSCLTPEPGVSGHTGAEYFTKLRDTGKRFPFHTQMVMPMQSTAKNVADYLDEVPAERRPTLTRLRELCLTTLIDFQESMMYGMPVYSRDGEVTVGFASQKNFIALYILRTDVMNSYRDMLRVKGVSLGKGCIRYSKPDKIDFKVVELILKATQESTGVICG